jgi:predicted nucleotidyltransferase
MGLDQILAILKDFKNQLAEKYGISEIGVFGSIARNEASENSDVDVVIRIKKPDLFLLAGIKSDLEEKLNRPVDIVTYRETMNRFLKKRIDGEAVYA